MTPEVAPRPGSKGRPTPSRREAEAQRKQRAKPPANRREAMQRQRKAAREERERRRQGLLAGDPRLLPRRDQGPVRAFVRDHVDARRSVAEFFLPMALVVLLMSLVGQSANQPAIANLVVLAYTFMLVLIITDSVVLGLRLRSQLRREFPDEDRRGAIPYGLLRSTQLRRLRLPRPRVRPGGKPV